MCEPGWAQYLSGKVLQKRFWIPFTFALLSSSSSEGVHTLTNLRAERRVTRTVAPLGLSGWDSPVKGASAVLKWILLSVSAEHFGPHRLEHVTVQQGLAHARHCRPGHARTYGPQPNNRWFIQALVKCRKTSSFIPSRPLTPFMYASSTSTASDPRKQSL